MCVVDGQMERHIIPIYNDNLPGAVKLPRRYEVCTGKCSLVSKRHSVTSENSSDPVGSRIADLTQAVLWIKQELVLLRQHDILLKRQFSDIQDTIHGLQTRSRRHKCGLAAVSEDSLQSSDSLDLGLDNYSFRSASSVTALHDTDTDTDDDLFRPRTSSMKTTRDLAALARRRGSKELI